MRETRSVRAKFLDASSRAVLTLSSFSLSLYNLNQIPTSSPIVFKISRLLISSLPIPSSCSPPSLRSPSQPRLPSPLLTSSSSLSLPSRIDRTITLYGYLRGTNLPAAGARVHIPGAGDLTVSSIEKLKDPCPLPTIEGEKRRKMGEKGKLIHAPMSDVGGVMFDKVSLSASCLGATTANEVSRAHLSLSFPPSRMPSTSTSWVLSLGERRERSSRKVDRMVRSFSRRFSSHRNFSC